MSCNPCIILLKTQRSSYLFINTKETKFQSLEIWSLFFFYPQNVSTRDILLHTTTWLSTQQPAAFPTPQSGDPKKPRGSARGGPGIGPLCKISYLIYTLSRCQISSTYSWIVLSEVNLPAHAVFIIAIRAQPFSSLYASSTFFCAAA